MTDPQHDTRTRSDSLHSALRAFAQRARTRLPFQPAASNQQQSAAPQKAAGSAPQHRQGPTPDATSAPAETVALMDVPVDHDDRVYLVERHVISKAELDALAHEYTRLSSLACSGRGSKDVASARFSAACAACPGLSARRTGRPGCACSAATPTARRRSRRLMTGSLAVSCEAAPGRRRGRRRDRAHRWVGASGAVVAPPTRGRCRAWLADIAGSWQVARFGICGGVSTRCARTPTRACWCCETRLSA